jgi:dienelactone hydrolase
VRWALRAIAIVALVVAARWTFAHVRAVALLAHLSGVRDDKLDALTPPVAVDAFPIDGDVPVRARLYVPKTPWAAIGARPRGMVLVPGVSWMGIDEPRLVAFARALAEVGVVVLTPELSSITEYKVDDPRNLAQIRAAVHALAARRDLVSGGGVALMGISFAGGLCLRVASEPEMASDVASVIALGGHNDMTRVTRFFVTDVAEGPRGSVPWHAHDYGLAVLVFNQVDRFVAPGDAPRLRDAVRSFLHERYARAENEALAMSPDGRAVYDRVFHRDTHAFADKVLASIPALAPSMLAASPAGHLRDVRAPIFLLHSAHDDVVPPTETEWNAKEAGDRADVHVLVTALLEHASLGQGLEPKSAWALVDFIAKMIDV